MTGVQTCALPISGLLAASGIQTAMILRELDFVSRVYSPEYGPPLAQSEQLARELADFGAASASTHLAIEFSRMSEPAAYLGRSSFPTIDLTKVGAVGFGERLARAADPRARPGLMLSPSQQLGLHYADAVDVLAAASELRTEPGGQVSLAMTWTVGDPGRAAGTQVLWQVSLLNAQGDEIVKDTGLQHDVTGATSREVVLSWFTLETPTDAPAGQYRLRLRRVDRRNGEPLPFVQPDGGSGSEWSSEPIQLIRT